MMRSLPSLGISLPSLGIPRASFTEDIKIRSRPLGVNHNLVFLSSSLSGLPLGEVTPPNSPTLSLILNAVLMHRGVHSGPAGVGISSAVTLLPWDGRVSFQ